MSLRGRAYVAVAVIGPFVALAFGRPAPALVALPFAVMAVVGLSYRFADRPVLEVPSQDVTTKERQSAQIEFDIVCQGQSVVVTLDPPDGVEVVAVRGARRIGPLGLHVPLRAGRATIELTVRAREWGIHTLGEVALTRFGPFRVRVDRQSVFPDLSVVVLPAADVGRSIIEPLATNLHVGDLTARQRGPGFDLAEIRMYQPGDSPRSLNWRSSMRSDDLWTTQRLAERSGDIVLLVDSFVEAGAPIGRVLVDIVRLAASLVETFGSQRQRLGLVSLAGIARWYGLGSGAVHREALLEALLRTQAVQSPVWMGIDRVLARAIRPPSMVVVVSALLEPALIGRVAALARSGIDVVVIEVDPAGWVSESTDYLRTLSTRIWQVEREEVRRRLRSAGIAVGTWHPDRPVEAVIEEVQRWRQMLRRAPV